MPSSVVGEEVSLLVKHYVNTRLRAAFKRDGDLLGIINFNILILRSCLIDELRQRLLSKPGKEWTFSVFEGRNQAGNQSNELKKLIYGNLRMFKPVKHVTFKGLPPIEEDEKRARKLMKDAPKGAEDANLDAEELVPEEPPEEASVAPGGDAKKPSVDKKTPEKARGRGALKGRPHKASLKLKHLLK